MEATLKDWLNSFWKIIIYPSQLTFINESYKAKGKIYSAIGWLVFIAAFSHLFIYVAFRFVYPVPSIIVTLLFFPFWFLFFVFCLDIVYRKIFHHNNSYYDEFLYIAVAIFVPYIVLSAPLSLIPAVGGYLAWASSIYPIVLLAIAIKSIAKLKIWEAAVTLVLSIIIGLSGSFCITLFILSMIGTVPRVF